MGGKLKTMSNKRGFKKKNHSAVPDETFTAMKTNEKQIQTQ